MSSKMHNFATFLGEELIFSNNIEILPTYLTKVYNLRDKDLIWKTAANDWICQSNRMILKMIGNRQKISSCDLICVFQSFPIESYTWYSLKNAIWLNPLSLGSNIGRHKFQLFLVLNKHEFATKLAHSRNPHIAIIANWC